MGKKTQVVDFQARKKGIRKVPFSLKSGERGILALASDYVDYEPWGSHPLLSNTNEQPEGCSFCGERGKFVMRRFDSI